MEDYQTMMERVSSRLSKALGEFYKIMPKRTRKEKPEDKKTKHAGSKNHSKGTTKKRQKMATMSNRINRSRIKKWKFN